MPNVDDEIDGLFKVPLAEFTAARNAVAARAGTRATAIKALQKPNAAAWAVNQVYWHRPEVFSALVAASETRRAAHVRRAAGRPADIETADLAHCAALDAALTAAVAALRDGEETVSPATVAGLTQTFDAVPSPSVNGRLSRPLEATGLSVLLGLMGGMPTDSRHARPPADVVTLSRAAAASPAARDAAAQATRAAEARRRDQVQVERDLTAARRGERDAGQALERVRRDIIRADRAIESLEQQLEAARAAAGERRAAADRATAALNDAVAERVRLERRRNQLG